MAQTNVKNNIVIPGGPRYHRVITAVKTAAVFLCGLKAAFVLFATAPAQGKTLWLKRAFYVNLSLAFLLLISAPRITYAESTNQNEVRANLAAGGWYVVYGDRINEADYALFVAAVASSVACECPAPIYKYFDYQLQQQLTKIRKTAPDIAQDALEDLLIKAFNSKGSILRKGRLEVSGGLATYKRWETVIYKEPRTYGCKWGICTTMETVEKRIPYPNNFQPYFRFRWTTDQPSSTSNFQIKFSNKCSQAVYLALNYLNESNQWAVKGWYEFAPGETATVAYTRNRIFEYYAEAKNVNYKWEGTDNYHTVRNSSRKYGFRRENITMNTYGTWTRTLTCTNLKLSAPQTFSLTASATATSPTYTTIPLTLATLNTPVQNSLAGGITIEPPEFTTVLPESDPTCPVDVCVTDLSVSPDVPKRGKDVTFTATFVNNTDQERTYDLLMLVFDPNKDGPNKGFGESPHSKTAVPPGVSTASVTYRVVTGPGPCIRLYAQAANYQSATEKAKFLDSTGLSLRAYFDVCP